MKGSRISILLAVLLSGLLAVLATMQYRWLGQISENERERLEKRLESDTRRFAEDFDREIQLAYFTFQFDAEAWRAGEDGKNFAEFNERLLAWRELASFPRLVRDFYFVQPDRPPLRYDAEQKVFRQVEWTDELRATRESLASGGEVELINEAEMTLTMPVYESAIASERMLGVSRRRVGETESIVLQPPGPNPPVKFGCLVIRLDETVVKNELLPALVRKYFSGGESGAYKLSVVSRADEKKALFGSAAAAAAAAGEEDALITKSSADASVPLFNLSPSNLAVFVNRELLSTLRRREGNGAAAGDGRRPPGRIILNQRMEKRRIPGRPPPQHGDKVNVLRFEAPVENIKQRFFQGDDGMALVTNEAGKGGGGGRWLLNVRHTDGSLENFIANARRKNLAISFGILLVLAAGVAFVFLSARRAQILAQRQMDFVSAVSHEFRTPLAVIYSAGENLSDGVVDSAGHVARYGNLIKREGKKLTAMVEQILEFAGARSGRKKYDLRETDVAAVVENALEECQSVIAEKGFTVESEIAAGLPKITADSSALSHAVQNLITNAVKYGNGRRWMRITAGNGGGRVKISVEDKGIGIAPKEAADIFKPFYRAKSVVDAQIHGNGLGLSLVKQTVEAHGGRVTVESEPGKGSRFTIEIPAVVQSSKLEIGL